VLDLDLSVFFLVIYSFLPKSTLLGDLRLEVVESLPKLEFVFDDLKSLFLGEASS